MFILALTLHIASPLCARLQDRDPRPAAIFYLSTCGIVCIAFAWCSFWAYRAAALVSAASEHVCSIMYAGKSVVQEDDTDEEASQT